jgi:hypothetical protein
MATSRAFTYNTGSLITGTEKFGNLTVGTPTSGFASTGLQWWNGPDEDLGYVIAKTSVNINGNPQQPTPIGSISGNVSFYRTSIKTNNAFLSLANSVTKQNFLTPLSAKTWLETNSYWTSWVNTSDPDAEAFLLAAGITDPTISVAINTLVNELKSQNLWTKMKAIYPFVGGTASTHKWNLKDPRDLDAAFRLAFFGGWTHDSNGITGNGSNGYANTYISPSSVLTVNNTHLSMYSRTNNAINGMDISSHNSNSNRIVMHIKWSDTNGYYDFYTFPTTRFTYSMSNTNSTGLFIMNRTSSTVLNAWRNSTKLGTNSNSQPATSGPSTNLVLASFDGTSLFSNRNYAFTSIGDGLSDTDATNLYSSVQTFQTTLNRQI